MSLRDLLAQTAALVGLLAFLLVDNLRDRILNVEPLTVTLVVITAVIVLAVNFGRSLVKAVRARIVPGLGNDFTGEVLPVLSVALMLNLGGASLGLAIDRSLFLDMAGTALTALLLGPWWAALVGLGSNLLEQLVFPETNAIHYAFVNAVGGLFWGFVGRVPYVREALLGPRQMVARVIASAVGLGAGAGLLCTAAAFSIQIFVRQQVESPINSAYVVNLVQGNTAMFLSEAARNVPDKTLSVILASLLARTVFPFCLRAGVHRVRRSGWLPLVLFVMAYLSYLLFALFRAFRHSEDQAIVVGFILVIPLLTVFFWGVVAELPRGAEASLITALRSRRSLYSTATTGLGDLTRFKLTVVLLAVLSCLVPVLLDQARGEVLARMLVALGLVVLLAHVFEFAARQNQAVTARMREESATLGQESDREVPSQGV